VQGGGGVGWGIINGWATRHSTRIYDDLYALLWFFTLFYGKKSFNE